VTEPTGPDVQTTLTANTVSATAIVAAPPEAVFDYIRRPANHPGINGDHTVKTTLRGPEVLALGDRFGMDMKMVVPYRMTSKVVEFAGDGRSSRPVKAGRR
jgi:uncharacterized protein YndB with AHSA1/START domain